MSLHVGQKLNNCSGYFVKSLYSEYYRVEAVGHDWVIVRTKEGEVDCALSRLAVVTLEEPQYSLP